jgi:hypothetical protein
MTPDAESGAERVLLWTGSIGRSVRTGNNYEIAVWIPHPALPMVRLASPSGDFSFPADKNLDDLIGEGRTAFNHTYPKPGPSRC